MDTLAAFLYELGYCAVFACGLQQLYFCLSYLEEGCLYLLVGHLFDGITFKT